MSGRKRNTARARGSGRWEQEMKALLDHSRTTQKDVAHRIAEVTKPEQYLRDPGTAVQSITPEVNRFVNGDPSTLLKWLGPPSHPFLRVFAEMVGRSENALREIHDRILHGDDSDDWHPSWPGVRRGEVEIPSPLLGRLADGRTIHDVGELVDEIQRVPTSETPEAAWIWIEGPIGSGRRTLAGQVQRALTVKASGGVPRFRILDKEPEDGWQHERERDPGPAIVVTARVPSAWRNGDLEVSPADWGCAETRVLVEALVTKDLLGPGKAGPCRELADRVERDPELLGDGVRPGQVIGLIRGGADGGTVRTPAEVRRTRLDAAWRKALGTPSAAEVLEALGEEILPRYFADLFASSEGSPWWKVTTRQAIQALERAANGRARGDVGLERARGRLERLIEAGPLTVSELEKFRDLLAAPSGEAALDALLQAGLLKIEDDFVVPVDADLAVLWAARGLALTGFRLDRWERLVEEDGLRLAKECAVAGVGARLFLQTIASAPEWACIDRARWAVVFLASMPDPAVLDPGTARALFLPAWSAALWSTVFGTFALEVPDRWETLEDPDLRMLIRALRTVSRAFREILPVLEGSDLRGALRSQVSKEVVDRSENWFQQAEVVEAGLPGTRLVALDFVGRREWDPAMPDAYLGCILALAPWQIPVVSTRRYVLMLHSRASEVARWPEILDWHAERGHEGARRVLSGVFLRTPHPDERSNGASGVCRPEVFWTRIPLTLRLKWIGRMGEERDAWAALSEVCRVDRQDLAEAPIFELLVDLMMRLKGMDPENVRRWIGVSAPVTRLEPGDGPLLDGLGIPRMDRALAMRLAERLGYPEILEDALRFTPREAEPPGEADQIVEAAAAALHRMERPEPLRRRWHEGIVSAARLLLDQGDETPLEDWATSETPAAQELTRLLCSDPWLDRAWELGADGPRRQDLIFAGAGGRQGGQSDSVPPRPWFFPAMRKEDRRMRTYWACEFRENPDVVPLVRDLHRESAPGSGERAFWTLLLHRHREWCREVLEALRTWACEDPEPFSGDPDYYELQDALEGRGKVRGGWKALLHLFVEIPPDKVGTWAREGALRLWGTLEPREPHKAAGNLVGILDRLGERAAIERVIDPTGPDPESESCDSPCSQAFHWWLGHASPAALHEALVTGDWRANGIATTLARRGVSEGIDWLCRSLSSRQEWTRVRSSLDLLVQKAPDRLFAEVDSLFRGFPEHGHSLLAWLAWLAKPPAGPVAREARLFLRRHHLQGEK